MSDLGRKHGHGNMYEEPRTVSQGLGVGMCGPKACVVSGNWQQTGGDGAAHGAVLVGSYPLCHAVAAWWWLDKRLLS